MATTSTRLPSLDGLRGVAALVVVVHHAALLVPVLSGAYFGEAIPAALGWLVFSPLHVLWDGAGPVFVFFILSGLVVPLPALRSRTFSWGDYFPRRLIRLYVPVVASLVIAYALIFLVPRAYGGGQSTWVQWHAVPADPTQFLRESVLIVGVGPANSPLWSLQWEIIFSLLLPVYVAVARLAARHLRPLAAVCVLLVGLGGYLKLPALTYLPMFGIGIVLAQELPRIDAWSERLRGARKERRVSVLLAVFAVGGLSWRWLATPMLGEAAYGLSFIPTVVGALAVLLLALVCRPVQSVLTTRPAQWAGVLSFSLYLVHDPILVTVAQFFPVRSAWIAAIVGIALSVACALAFYRIVERPSHAIARRAGRAGALLESRSKSAVRQKVVRRSDLPSASRVGGRLRPE